jgi:hypothetical protein
MRGLNLYDEIGGSRRQRLSPIPRALVRHNEARIRRSPRCPSLVRMRDGR